MKNIVAMFLIAGAASCGAGEKFEDRWVYVSCDLTKPKHVQEVADIVRTAKSVDLNGMLFACGVERWHAWSADRKARLAEIRRICGEVGVEIIPIVWSVGYGGRCHARTRRSS